MKNDNQIYTQTDSNNQEFNKIIIIQKNKNKNKTMQFNNTINYETPKTKNIDINVDIDKTHNQDSKINLKNNSNINLNIQKRNISNLENGQNHINPHPKVIIQKIKKKKDKNPKMSPYKEQIPINTKITKNNNENIKDKILSSSIKSFDSAKEYNHNDKFDENSYFFLIQQKENMKNNINNKEEGNKYYYTIINKEKSYYKDNYNYFINNQIDKKENINILNTMRNDNVANVREELIFNNNNNIPIPQTQKIVERMLGINNKKEENTIINDGKTSFYDIRSHMIQRQNIPFNINNNSEINSKLSIINLKRQNINNFESNNLNIKLNNNLNNSMNNINTNVFSTENQTIKNPNNNLSENKKLAISPQKNINVNNHINNSNINQEPIKFIINKNNNNQPNLNIIGQTNQNQNTINSKIQYYNLNQNPSQQISNIIPQQNKNVINIKHNNTNISINNIQIPPSTNSSISLIRNPIISPMNPMLNLIPQKTLSLSKNKEPSHMNNNILKINHNLMNNYNTYNPQNIIITQQIRAFPIPVQQNIHLIQKSNSNPNIFNKQSQLLQVNQSFINQNIQKTFYQQHPNIVQSQNININKSRENFFIKNQQNFTNIPQNNININNNQVNNINTQQNNALKRNPSNDNIRQNINIPYQDKINMNPYSFTFTHIPIYSNSNNQFLINSNLNQQSNINFFNNQNLNFPFNQNIRISQQSLNKNIQKNNNNSSKISPCNNSFQNSNINLFQKEQNLTQYSPNIVHNQASNINQSPLNILENQNIKILHQPKNLNFPLTPNLNTFQINNNDFISSNYENSNKIQLNELENLNNKLNLNEISINSFNFNNRENLDNNHSDITTNIIKSQINSQNIINNSNNYSMNLYQNSTIETKRNLDENQIISNCINSQLTSNNLFNQRQNSLPTEQNSYNLSPKNINNPENNNQNIKLNMNINQEDIKENKIKKDNAQIEPGQNNQNNFDINQDNLNKINNIQKLNTQNKEKKIVNINLDNPQPQTEKQSKGQNKLNNPKELKSKRINKKGKSTITNKKMTKISEYNEHKPTKQYKIERKRPVFAVPPSKRRSLSQGKPFNIIRKYYDESYILEDDEEDASKNENCPK